MSRAGSSAARFILHAVGLARGVSQVSDAERACLARHAAGRRRLVEIGVLHGVTTALLRGAMAEDGVVTGIDPHPAGRLGVSFERWIALREIARSPRGRAVLVRATGAAAAAAWREPIDFLFVDGDHAWAGIDADWRGWSGHVAPGGVVALHDSRSVAERADLDSVRYTREVVLRDPRFREIDAVESLMVLERVP